MNNLDDKNCSFVSCKDDTYYFKRGVSSRELVFAASRVMESKILQDSEVFTNVDAVAEFVRLKLGMAEREIFACMFLNNKHELIEYEELFFGTIDGCSVHPREVVKRALHHNCSAVVIAHNHPSGHVKPSQSDIRITEKIKSVLAIVDIRLLDHFIVSSATESCSFAERGLL